MAKSGQANPELTEVLNELWHLDTNRLKPGTDYVISLQAQAGNVVPGSNSAKDKASAPLFTYVNEDKLKSIKTFACFMKLLDNYEMSTGVPETVTSEELEENQQFIDAIMETEVMKCAHKYLMKKGKSLSDPEDFKKQLYDMWFRLFPSEVGRCEDTCGFEHVFVGETELDKEIMGLHNWVQFYLQEKQGNVDYKGYKAKNKKDKPDEDDHVLSLQFSWKGLVKPIGSTFIGVSPEFEIALFTIVFLMSTEEVTSVVVKVDKYLLEIIVCRHEGAIGTSYPKLLSSNNRDL